MKMNFFSCTILLVLGFFFAAIEVQAQSPAPEDGYKLVWADEFSKDPDGLPDATKWIYEEGFIRNNESQYYTKGRLENARIEHGQLIIEGRKESFVNPSSTGPKMANYTSAALETKGKAEWQYGRIEVRAKLPSGKGVWPAIWTLGTDIDTVGWPRCGEIDIMELVGHEPHLIHGTIHYFADGKHASMGNQLTIDNPNDFHAYKAEWTPGRIDLFVDDKKYVGFDVDQAANQGENPFRKPHSLILNVALGGDWGGPIEDSIFPQRMTIDYVRVYQKTTPTAP